MIFVPLDANIKEDYTDSIRKEVYVLFSIREAISEDAVRISQIIASSWRSAYQELIDPADLARVPEEYWVPSMRIWLSSGRMYSLIAEQGDQAVGCIVFGRSRDEAYADWGEIVSLYLLPEAMGKGIGKALLQHALLALKADGYSRVYLWSIQGNRHAEQFYLRQGFIPTNEEIQYRVGSSDVTDLRLILEE